MCQAECKVLIKWLSLHDTAQMVPAPSSHLSSVDICELQPAKNKPNVKISKNILKWKDGWRVIWTNCSEKPSCQEWAVFFLCPCLNENVHCQVSNLWVFLTALRNSSEKLSRQETCGKSACYQTPISSCHLKTSWICEKRFCWHHKVSIKIGRCQNTVQHNSSQQLQPLIYLDPE